MEIFLPAHNDISTANQNSVKCNTRSRAHDSKHMTITKFWCLYGKNFLSELANISVKDPSLRFFFADISIFKQKSIVKTIFIRELVNRHFMIFFYIFLTLFSLDYPVFMLLLGLSSFHYHSLWGSMLEFRHLQNLNFSGEK